MTETLADTVPQRGVETENVVGKAVKKLKNRKAVGPNGGTLVLIIGLTFVLYCILMCVLVFVYFLVCLCLAGAPSYLQLGNPESGPPLLVIVYNIMLSKLLWRYHHYQHLTSLHSCLSSQIQAATS